MALRLTRATAADAEEVRAFAFAHPDGRLDHTWLGCRVMDHETAGRWSSNLCLARDGDTLAAVMPYSIARVRGLPLALGRSSAGPLVAPNAPPETFSELLRWLVAWARDERCARLELRLLYPETIAGEPVASAASLLRDVCAQGFRRARGAPFGTYWVPLGDEEEMLARMRLKPRRDARRGIRKGVSVERQHSLDSLRAFFRDYSSMSARKALAAKSEASFMDAIGPCLEAGAVGLFTAIFEGEVCNSALVTLTGRPYYWYGASGPAVTRKGFPPSGQPLHLAIMKHLASTGHGIYDLGGSPGPEPQQGHPNYGVWSFKHGFGGDYVYFLDWFSLVLAPVSSALLDLAYRTSRVLRR